MLVTLTWTDDCPSGECDFHVERGDAKSKGQVNFDEIAVGTGQAYTVTEQDAGTYYYRVYVTTVSDTSADSNVVNVRLR